MMSYVALSFSVPGRKSHEVVKPCLLMRRTLAADWLAHSEQENGLPEPFASLLWFPNRRGAKVRLELGDGV